MWIKLQKIASPIVFEGAEKLVPVLEQVLCGWTLKPMAQKKGTPQITITAGPKGFIRQSPWAPNGISEAFLDPVDAVCDLLLDMERAYVEYVTKAGENVFLLHAAGVKMGHGVEKGVVVFPATHESGKSLLSVALAKAGHQIFADDQLPVVKDKKGKPFLAQAPGFLPRLRRPLPTDLKTDFLDYIRSHNGPLSHRFRYVDLGHDSLAPFGEQAPIRAVVALDRQPGAMPKCETITEAEILKACVMQSFGRNIGALEVLDNLHALVKSVPCIKLTYDNVHEATAMLQEKFS